MAEVCGKVWVHSLGFRVTVMDDRAPLAEPARNSIKTPGTAPTLRRAFSIFVSVDAAPGARSAPKTALTAANPLRRHRFEPE